MRTLRTPNTTASAPSWYARQNERMNTMQRRPSHPYSQLTGLIVIVSLMISVAVMFWLPSQPQHTPALAAANDAPTPALPSAPEITRTPRPEQGPSANIGASAEPSPAPVDWGAIPTAIPADQLIQPTVAPEVVYVPGPVQTVYVEVPAAGAADVTSAPPAAPLAELPTLNCPCGPTAEEQAASDAYQQRRLDAIHTGDAYRPSTR